MNPEKTELVIEASLLETADLKPEVLNTKKVEKELTRSLFSASVCLLYVW